MEMEQTQPHEENLTFHIDGKRITACRARIIILQCYGVARKNIAATLGLSINTVDTQLDRIHKILAVHNQGDLVGWATEHGLRNKGFVQGIYLFSNYTGLPWENRK